MRAVGTSAGTRMVRRYDGIYRTNPFFAFSAGGKYIYTDAFSLWISDGTNTGSQKVSPVGLQPWPRVVLHALFDAMVHERDVTEPVGRSAPPTPELLPLLAYVLLVAARVACFADREFAVPVDLGGQVLGVAVHGAAVEVVPVGRNGELGLTNVATNGSYRVGCR